MAEPLKNIYNRTFITKFSDVLSSHLNGFDQSKFIAAIFSEEWNDLELKERMRHITRVLHSVLPANYEAQIEFIKSLLSKLRNNGFKDDNLEFIFLPDFIECYGLDHPDISLQAMNDVTKFVTCEFAIRPFLVKYPEKTINLMTKWSEAKHWSVRRLATEGCRPRLPWAIGVPSLKKDPTVVLPILNNLKKDSSESVRRSVANNINDISKDHPNIVIRIVKEWMDKDDIQMYKLLKHGSRTLLKQGHPDILPIFGYKPPTQIEILDFAIEQVKIKIGDYLNFSFILKNNSSNHKKLRLEYQIYYQKANGTLSPKVYMISEKDFPPHFTGLIERKQSFKQITTRKFHKGLHKIGIVVNGVEKSIKEFQLL